VITDNHCYQNKHCGIAIVNSSHVLVQANACYENTTGIGLFAQDVPGAGNHVIGVNMLYDNVEADLKGMSKSSPDGPNVSYRPTPKPAPCGIPLADRQQAGPDARGALLHDATRGEQL
jgi:parallel beta-helix repeat protein